jgi:hypothetical protein
MSTITLSDDALREIREHAVAQLEESLRAYRWLLDELRKTIPSVTDDAIAAVKEHIQARTHQDNGHETTRAAWCCAMFQLALDRGKECITRLKVGSADGEVLRNLMWVTSTAFEMLTRLAVTINGGPFAQRMADEMNKQRDVARAKNAARSRHEQSNEARKWVQMQWAETGARFNSKAEFARYYVQLVAEQYSVKVTEKIIAESWLSPAALN